MSVLFDIAQVGLNSIHQQFKVSLKIVLFSQRDLVMKDMAEYLAGFHITPYHRN